MIGPLVVTMGEPAGIGGEIALLAWQERARKSLPPFVMIDDADRLQSLARALGLSVPIEAIDSVEAGPGRFAQALPVLDRPLPVRPTPGRPDVETADGVLGAINEAVELTLTGRAAAMVTNPIHKETLYRAGFAAPGHTEYLVTRIVARLGEPRPQAVMMLTCPGLRVVPVTIHRALGDAIRALTTETIVAAGLILEKALRADFAIPAPRIAVAALNPHGGEGGALGREEIDIIAPACDELRHAGLAVDGPAPADTLFHAAARMRHDAVLCMYHDQALIPLKTIDFAHGVNVTLGLPLVRTSPDHGTALDLAGRGTADPSSLIAALETAAAIAARRARSKPA